MSELQEYQFYLVGIYDEYLYKTENRGASYGEIAYIQEQTREELEELEREILEELEKLESKEIEVL